jgi:hypothetical protein
MTGQAASLTGTRRSRIGLWFSWIGATTISSIVALAFVDASILSWFPDRFNYRNDNEIGPLSLWACGFVIVVAPLVGLFQALLLRAFTTHRRWGLWIFYSASAIFLSIAIMLLLSVLLETGADIGWSLIYWSIAWATLPGLVLGAMQSMALSFVTRNGGWWVIIVSFAWTSGAVTSSAVRSALFTEIPHTYPFYPVEAAFQWGVGWAVAAFVFSVITGGGLLVLLRDQLLDDPK